MATPLDIVTGALRAVGATAGGEPPGPNDANDAFNLLNDLLDQLSNERMMIPCVQEVIHELTGNVQQYSIGPGGSIGATFTGSISGTALTVTALSSGALSVGQILSGVTSLAGTVNSAALATAGVGYLTNPGLVFSGGGGSGATATSTLQLISVPAAWAAGAGYSSFDIVTLVGGTFTRPAQVQRGVAGFGFQVVDGGAYTVLPGTPFTFSGINATGTGGTVPVTGGTGAGLQLQCIWGLGAPVLGSGGTGYIAAPTLAPSGGSPNTPGTLTATIAQAGTAILSGTAITSYGTAQGGNGPGALGTYFLNFSQTIGSSTITSTAPRPLRINSALVRVVNSLSGTLDYPVSVMNVEQWKQIGQKTLPGPWPYALYYQPSEPLGILNYYPNPAQGEMHLFCDTVLNRFATLSDTIILPQGYAMALRWMLAEILMPEYPATAAEAEVRAMIPEFARQGRALIKRTNMQPPPVMTFDPILSSAKKNDAGWIISGGFT